MGCACTSNTNKDQKIKANENKGDDKGVPDKIPGAKATVPGVRIEENVKEKEKEKEQEVTLHFLLNNETVAVKEKIFVVSAKFSEVVEYIDQTFDKKGREYNYHLCYGKAVVDIIASSSNTLKSVFHNKNPDNVVSDFKSFNINIKKIGFTISNNIFESLQSTQLIGRPIDETMPFEVLVYDKAIQKAYTLSVILNYDLKELNYFSQYSSYCNANNTLYISGGEIIKLNHEGQYSNSTEDNLAIGMKLNKSYSIDLKTGYVKRLKDLLESRTWHSMIYIPDKLIFIVGGSGSKSVEVYDIHKNTYTRENQLNEERSEPTLCAVNSEYLYAFFGYDSNQNYLDSIERLPLHTKERKWEIVKFDREINSRFFSISLLNDSEVLIFGGQSVNDDNRNKESNRNYFNFTVETYKFDFKRNQVFNGKNVVLEHFFGEKFCWNFENGITIFPLGDSSTVFSLKNDEITTIEYDENLNKFYEFSECNDLASKKSKENDDK